MVELLIHTAAPAEAVAELPAKAEQGGALRTASLEQAVAAAAPIRAVETEARTLAAPAAASAEAPALITIIPAMMQCVPGAAAAAAH